MAKKEKKYTGRDRVKGDGCAYYIPYRVRKDDLYKKMPRRYECQFKCYYDSGWFTNGHFAIKTDEEPKELVIDSWGNRLGCPEDQKGLSLERVMNGWASSGMISSDVVVGGVVKDFDGEPKLHVRKANGKDILFNPMYVDKIFTLYPGASLSLKYDKEMGSTLLFHDGAGDLVGAVQSFKEDDEWTFDKDCRWIINEGFDRCNNHDVAKAA